MFGQYDIIDRRFRDCVILNAPFEKLCGDLLWAEGPVYFADGDFLIWSDIPNDRMMRWVPGIGAGEYRRPANFSNGNTRDRQGRLVSCEHGARRVSRTEPDGRVTVIADRYRGKRLNSPNDVVVKSDGGIWFTDPDYGIMTDYEGYKAESEIGACNVYRCDPRSGEAAIVADDFAKPNGLCFSPDETRLYIADSARSHDPKGPCHVRVFDLRDGQSLAGGRVFAEIDTGIPDGIRCDTEGNLWVAAGEGVNCYEPGGALLGRIRVPEAVANITFGGPRRSCLFITATTSVYRLFVNRVGAQTP